MPNNYTITVKDILNGCTNTTAPIAIVNSVNDVIVNVNPLPLKDCDPNNDGFVAFDLTQIINSITGGNPGYAVTFHETEDSATVGGEIIPSPLSYGNINPWNQTIFVRVDSNATTCFEVVPLQLIVDPTPVATEPDDYELCDSTGAVGFESFDLTTTIPEILGSLNPLIHAVTFYTSQAAAQAGTGSITNPTSYTSETQTIYVRVENILTGCYDILTLQLIVNPLPTIVQPLPPYILNDNGNDGYETFNLSSQNNIILGGQSGMSVTFYPSLANAQNNTNSINNTTSYINTSIYNQTLGIRVTNNATGCYNISTMDITVQSLGINDTEIVPLQFAPNPVKTNLELQSTIVLQSVIIYNVLGQKVYEKIINDTSAILDLSNLKTGSYLVKIDAETGQKIIRIAKE